MQILELPIEALPAAYYRAILSSGWSVFRVRFAWIMVPVKEIEILYRLFLVNCYLLHVPRLPFQPASNVGGLVIH